MWQNGSSLLAIASFVIAMLPRSSKSVPINEMQNNTAKVIKKILLNIELLPFFLASENVIPEYSIKRKIP